ncbi:Major facilitator superfamily MFS_1 [Paraburkholderia piptadeniae]|uniref:Major facilitator superfamily MFS_1 n=1 Tax=Paraburkholderia piptadeniae TaxID=1701573 RepID=A0A1N7SG42_9BURK|nr:MFS transporter [Paraburkholderia piptadeniae]SIT46366.1 Major facilitator superfamily MFS_1 [Paraburkholderia piptadeniae]
MAASPESQQNAVAVDAASSGALVRYLQLGLLTLAAGALYPLLYLRQNFEVTILNAFGINVDQLGECYTLLGIIYVVTYIPSGWLADRISSRWLVVFSLSVVGLLGFWFATYPGFAAMKCIFFGWGIAGGLTFWSAMLRAVKLLANQHEQGRFFGILDGGRGLTEAILASLAIAIFAHYANDAPQVSLRPVIHMYAGVCLAIAALSALFLPNDGSDERRSALNTSARPSVLRDFLMLARIPEIWLISLIVLAGYQLLWATFYFSSYIQQHFAASAVLAGELTVIKLWMRPIGAIGGGFLGDRYTNVNVLGFGMLAASVAWMLFVLVPSTVPMWLLAACIVVLGLMTYSVHGLYWAIIDRCDVPARVTGLAVGIISMVGLSPDIYLPMLTSAISHRYPGALGTQIYFVYIGVCCLAGSVLVLVFKKRTVHYRFPGQ